MLCKTPAKQQHGYVLTEHQAQLWRWSTVTHCPLDLKVSVASPGLYFPTDCYYLNTSPYQKKVGDQAQQGLNSPQVSHAKKRENIWQQFDQK